MPSGSGMVPTMMVQSLLQLHKPYPCAFMSVERQRIDKARNAIAMEALNKGFDYLFFIDDDNPIPPDTLEKFIEDDKDIMVAPILSRNPNKDGVHDLCAFYGKESVHSKPTTELMSIDPPVRLYFPITVFKEEGYLHKVDGAGTGCMLIKRKVLEAVYKKYKDYMFEFGDIKFSKDSPLIVQGISYDRRTMSEDVEFCERAIDLGFELWLDERIKPLHISGMKVVQYGV